MTSKAVCHFVQQTFGVSYTPNAMTKLLKRQGYVYKKPKCVPAKADALTQQRFHDGTLLPLMHEVFLATPATEAEVQFRIGVKRWAEIYSAADPAVNPRRPVNVDRAVPI
jgi:hypothetical protein